MMDQQQSLRGAALYNPHLHSKNELMSLFVARQGLLGLLLEDLRATASGKTPQHHLILGQRGMGKTMLLRRLAYAIEEDPTLREGWLSLTFPEEQYNIARLSDFWLNCTDALSDLLESTGQHVEANALDEQAEALRRLAEERRARGSLALLVGTAKRLGRRLILLVDNVDLIFDRIKAQEWALREVLASEPTLVLIGASANAVESSFSYSQAFYDFFRVHELEGLSLEETRRLLIHYAGILGLPEVRHLAEQEPVRIKVLHNLTGGNPRTIVLLFNVLATGADGDVRTDLERLLDQSTPLYKARFEALPTQAQQVVHALAVHWDPVSAGELAEELTMDVSTVSSQLNRLVKQGIVEKVAYDPETKTGFQVAERFFNIWYLMRASRRVRRRLLWLVEFLKMFYSQDQLRAKAFSHIQSGLELDPSQRLRYAEHSFALAGTMLDRTWSRSLEKSGLHALLRDDALRSQITDLLDLETEPDLQKRVEQQRRLQEARSDVIAAQVDLPGWSGEDFWNKLKDSSLLHLEGKVWIAENLGSLEQDRISLVKSQLDSEPEVLAAHYACPKTVEALTKAIHTGLMTGPLDLEGASHAESVLATAGLQAIVLANLLDLKPDRTLLSALQKVLNTTTSPFPGLVWLRRIAELKKRPGKTKIAGVARKILEISNSDQEVIQKLGEALHRMGCFAEAEAAYRSALSINDRSAVLWENLGTILGILGRYGESEEALRKCLELDPKRKVAWTHLGNTLSGLRRYEEAEQAHRKAVELAPENDVIWINLGTTLGEVGRFTEAEQAFRKAISLEQETAIVWRNLGKILVSQGRFSEAEEAYRKAIQIDPRLPFFKKELAWLLLLHRENYDEAESLARGLSDTESEGVLGILATTSAHKGNWKEATEHARKFVAQRVSEDWEGKWPRTIVFFREAVRVGKVREAVEILEETGAAERWRPLREALEAVARGSKSYLRRVAPEVREPAREILEVLLEPASNNRNKGRRSTKTAGGRQRNLI